MNADTILGINPGTRFIGIAIMRNGILVHFQIRAFHGAWSQKKLKKMLIWIERIIDRYQVTRVAIKIPDVFPTSAYYNRLIGSINVFFENNEVKPRYCTTTDIMERFCRENSQGRGALIETMTRKFPELTPEFKKEKRNKNAHYYRLFEAVAAALM